MSEEVLFTITKENVEIGLRGVPAGYCTTSEVDPNKGLSYRGYLIKDLAYKDPEEVIHLLLKGFLPSGAEKDAFKKEIALRANLKSEVIDSLRTLPKKAHPMKWLIAGLNLLGMYHRTGDVKEDAMRVIALIPELVAVIFRLRSGWGDPIKSKPEIGYMENFVHMLSPPNQGKNLVELMRVFDILHFDHGGGNVSAFSAKVVSSAHSDVFESLVAAMCGLAGPLHGRANQESIVFLKQAAAKIKNVSDEEEVYNYAKNLFESGGKIFGFGHAVLRVEDTRATVLYELGQKIATESNLFRLASTMRKAVPKYLKTQSKVSDPYPNVDAISGPLLDANGLHEEEYYSMLFGLSRCVGIACQLVYERVEAKNGKGTPLIRPKYIYSGARH